MSGSTSGPDDPPATPGHVWVDGRILPADGPHLSVFDRGFQLGDGIFETLRVRGARATELAEHIARLRSSAAGLDIDLPDDLDEVLGVGIADLLVANGLDGPAGDASVRITVSRGAYRGRGLLPPDETVAATIAIQAWPVAAPPAGHLERGLRLVASTVRRDPANPLATLKTTSRADYVYARLEARRAGADDALFLTTDGHLSEGTTANIFLVRRAADDVDELATPSLDCAILPGTTRSWLLVWAARAGTSTGRGSAQPGRPGLGRRGVPVVERRRGLAGDVVRGRPDRRWAARAVDAACPRRPRGDDRGRGRDMTRDELIAGTRQLVDEGDRLRANPSLPSLQMWLQRSDDLLATAWGSMDRYHLAWLMVGKPKGIVRGRPMTPDEEAAYVREVAEQKTAALRMSLDAVERQGMPFVGESGGVGPGDRHETGPAPDRAPDRAGLPADPALTERLAEARRQAEAHLDHDAPRAPRPEKMQR